MKVILPDGLHGHQHSPLSYSIPQSGNAQRPLFSIAFGDVNPSGWQGLIMSREKFFPQPAQLSSQPGL